MCCDCLSVWAMVSEINAIIDGEPVKDLDDLLRISAESYTRNSQVNNRSEGLIVPILLSSRRRWQQVVQSIDPKLSSCLGRKVASSPD
jgi:hypothetical protein